MSAGDWHYIEMLQRNNPNKNGDSFDHNAFNQDRYGEVKQQIYNSLGVPRQFYHNELNLNPNPNHFTLTRDNFRDAYNRIRDYRPQVFEMTVTINQQQLEDIQRWALNSNVTMSSAVLEEEEEVNWAKEGF